MIRLIIIAIALAVSIGCEPGQDKTSADYKQAQATKRSMDEAQRQVGMPNIVNFQERKLMKNILELRDKEDLITYAYIADMHGKLHYIGQCIGFGLPYSVQFTNPERFAVAQNIAGAPDNVQKLPQPDPNGLFMPQGLSATWLMMINPNSGEVRPVYVEPQIIVSPFPLH